MLIKRSRVWRSSTPSDGASSDSYKMQSTFSLGEPCRKTKTQSLIYTSDRGKPHKSLSISPGTASESAVLMRMKMLGASCWKCSCRHRTADAPCHQLHKGPAGAQCGCCGQSFQLLQLKWTVIKKAKLQAILEDSLVQTIFSAKTHSLSTVIFAVHVSDGECKHIPVCGVKTGKSYQKYRSFPKMSSISQNTTAPSFTPFIFLKL